MIIITTVTSLRDIKTNKTVRLEYLMMTKIRILPQIYSIPECMFGVVRVAHIFSCLCCPVVFLCVLISVLCFPLRFPHKNNVRFVHSSSCL